MSSNLYRLQTLPKNHWILAACLNLVGKRGLTPDEALDRIIEAGIPFDFMYQWSEKRQEIDVLAVFYIAKLDEIPITDEQHLFLWNLFGNESLLGMGSGSIRDYENIPIRKHIEKNKSTPPQKPSWYTNLGIIEYQPITND